MSPQEYDLTDDAPRYVVEALATIREQDPKRTVDSYDLADAWVLPKPSNYIELRDEFAEDIAEKKTQVDPYEVKVWLIGRAINDVNANNTDAIIDVDVDGMGNYLLNDEVDIHGLQMRGEPLFPKTVPMDLFTPGGKWANNSRTYDPAKLGALRESMKAIGWPKHLPAIGDKRTKDSDTPIIIVGHRRIEVAEQLGIEPNIEWVDFGEGPAAEAAKIALAIASNTGGENISPAQRRKIAEDLYGSDKFNMDQIADLLHVSVMTISRDLRDLTDVKKTETRGRPRKKPTPAATPEPTPPAPPN